MTFGKWMAVVFLGLGCGMAAHAQYGVYFGYTGERLGGITCLSLTQTPSVPCSSTSASIAGSTPSSSLTGSVNPSGIYFGGYWDFKTLGPVRLGADVRYYDAKSNKSASSATGGPNATTANTVLGGVRGTFHTHYSWLKPYGEIAFGQTSSNATEPSCSTISGGTLVCGGTSTTQPRKTDNFFQYEGFAGLDIRITSVLDLRPVELGIGDMTRFGSGGAGTTSSVSVRSIGAAIVFHTPPR